MITLATKKAVGWGEKGTFVVYVKRVSHTPIGKEYRKARENDGTERDIEGVGWDMSIPLKLFLVLDGNGNAFPETSAQSGAYFQLRIVDVEIPFSIILKLHK